MLSKLTFSLTSIVLLLVIALCLPVSAQKTSSKSEVLLQVPASPATSGIIAVGDGMDAGFVVYGRNTTQANAGISTGVAAGTYWSEATDGTGRLPDLEDFFRFGGTLELLAAIEAPADAAATDNAAPGASKALKAKDIVISEIMWALDVDAHPGTVDNRNQWIELYNTTGAAIGKLRRVLLLMPFLMT